MRFAAAIFFALAIAAAQAAHGGVLIPVLAYPAYALVALGGLCAFTAVFSSPRQPWPMLVMMATVLAVYMMWRCANAPDAALAAADVGVILACFTMWAGMSLALRQNDARFIFVIICLLAACVQVGVALVQIVKHGDFSQPFWFSEELKNVYSARFPQRPRGLYMNPNQFAWLMNTMALMALSLGIWGRLRAVPRVTFLYLAVIFGVMTILSASRGGTMSLLAGFSAFLGLSVVALFSSVGHRRFLLLGMGLGLVAVCAGAVYLAFSTSWVAQGRLSALLLPEVRSVLVEEGVRLFQTAPLLGAGPGMYLYAARLYRTGDISGDPIFAHDDWLQFSGEYGFVGMAMLLVVLVLGLVAGCRTFLALVRLASNETGSAMSSSGAFVLGAVCALVAGAVHGNVDFNMHVPANALLTAALFGLVTGARPFEFEKKISRFRPIASLTALSGLVAAAGLGALLIQRGEADYRGLRAANAFPENDVKRALEETEKGLRKLPDDPALLALRGRGFFEYETWLQVVQSEKMGKTAEGQAPADESSDESAAEDGEETFVDEPVLLSPAESAKNFRDSAEFFSRAVKVQPLDQSHHVGWANALASEGLDEEARRQFIETVRLDPYHANAWAKYGDFLNEREQIAAARRIYEIGANLPSGEYCRSQVESIDEDLAPQGEAETQ